MASVPLVPPARAPMVLAPMSPAPTALVPPFLALMVLALTALALTAPYLTNYKFLNLFRLVLKKDETPRNIWDVSFILSKNQGQIVRPRGDVSS
jgi:hypothetical protein